MFSDLSHSQIPVITRGKMDSLIQYYIARLLIYKLNCVVDDGGCRHLIANVYTFWIVFASRNCLSCAYQHLLTIQNN